MTPRVVGVDPSLRSTGLVTDSPRGFPGLHEELISFPKLTDPHRMNEIRTAVMRRCIAQVEYEPGTLVMIEGFAFGANGRAASQVAGLGWILRSCFFEVGIPYVEVAPTVLKTFATGKGNGNKTGTISSVTHRTGRVFTSDDIVDALVLYSIGRAMLGLEHPLGSPPQTHTRALDKLELPEGIF